MKAKTRVANENSDDFNDLDAMVLAEIESLQGGLTLRRGRIRRAARAEDARDDAKTDASTSAPMRAARIHGDDRAERGYTGEEAELLFDSEALKDGSGNVNEHDDAPESLFSAEEQAFLARAVGFLSGRDNADMILGRIWEQLTAEQPDAFFDPTDTEHGVNAPNVAPAAVEAKPDNMAPEPGPDGG